MLKLTEGVQFYISDAENLLLQGALLAVVADTPASHLLGGFKEGVGGAFCQVQTL